MLHICALVNLPCFLCNTKLCVSVFTLRSSLFTEPISLLVLPRWARVICSSWNYPRFFRCIPPENPLFRNPSPAFRASDLISSGRISSTFNSINQLLAAASTTSPARHPEIFICPCNQPDPQHRGRTTPLPPTCRSSRNASRN